MKTRILAIAALAAVAALLLTGAAATSTRYGGQFVGGYTTNMTAYGILRSYIMPSSPSTGMIFVGSNWVVQATAMGANHKFTIGAMTTNIASLTLSTNGTASFVLPPIASGASLTNLGAANIAAGGTLPALNGAALTNLSAANIAAGGTLPALNAANLTNIVVASTNAYADAALWATNWTSGNVIDHLTVAAAAASDGIVAAVRRATGQTNDIFQVQTAANGFLFGVESNGVPRATMYRAMDTNAVILVAPGGGSWLLHVNDDGTLGTTTNSAGL